MTEEKLSKANGLVTKTKTAKHRLEVINRWMEYPDEAKFHGMRINQGILGNTEIRPTSEEMRVLLTLMKDRMERELKEFEKEFENL